MMTSRVGAHSLNMDLEHKKHSGYPALQTMRSGSSHRRNNSEVSKSREINHSGNAGSASEHGSLVSKVLKLKNSLSSISTHISVDLIQEEEHLEHLEKFLGKLKQAVVNTQAALAMADQKQAVPMSNRANHSMNLSNNYLLSGLGTARPRLWSGSGTVSRGHSRDSTPPTEQKLGGASGLAGRGKRQYMSSPRIYSPEGGRLSGERTLPKMKVIENDYIVVDETDQIQLQRKDQNFETRINPISPITNRWNSQPFNRGASKNYHKRNRSELSDVLQQSRSAIRRAIDDELRTSYTRVGTIGQAATARATNKQELQTATTRTTPGDKVALSAQLGSFKNSEPKLNLGGSNHRRTKTRPDEQLELDVDQNYVLVRADARERLEGTLQTNPTKILSSASRGNVQGHKATHANPFSWNPAIGSMPSKPQANKKNEVKLLQSDSKNQVIQQPKKSEKSGGIVKQTAEQLLPEKLMKSSGIVNVSNNKPVNSLQKQGKELQSESAKANKLDKIFSVGLVAGSGNQLNISSIKCSNASATDQGGSSTRNWLKLYKPPSVLQSQLKSSMQDLHVPSAQTYRGGSQNQQPNLPESPLPTLTSKQGSLESLEEVHNFNPPRDPLNHPPEVSGEGQTEDASPVSKLPVTIFPMTLGVLPGQLEMIPEVSKDVSQPTNTLFRESPQRSRQKTTSGGSAANKHPPPTARLKLK